MQNDFGMSLKAARKARGYTQGHVGAALGVTYAAVQQWEAGKTRPTAENFRELCKLLNLSDDIKGMFDFESAGFRVELEDPERSEAERTRFSSEIERAHDQDDLFPTRTRLIRDVPIYGVAAAGDDGDFYFNGTVDDYAVRPYKISQEMKIYAIYVISDSMSPRYEPGDLLYVSPTRAPAIGDYVVVEMLHPSDTMAGAAYIKRLRRRTSKVVILEQFNPPAEIELSAEDVRAVHRVFAWQELIGE